LIPSPITSSLAALEARSVPCLVMGGQACVLYGSAEFSRDLDLVIAAHGDALERLHAALTDLQAQVIAVPPLRLDLLERGHAVHFRCARPDVAGLRIDVLLCPPRIADVAGMWERRVLIPIPGGAPVPVVALADLVATKKTQRDKDWAMIGQLVDADMVAHREAPAAEQVRFWLREAREADQLILLAASFPDRAAEAAPARPLLQLAIAADHAALELALAREQIQGKTEDRAYWAPLLAELEQIRRARHRSGR
jgi:hypothetical protein